MKISILLSVLMAAALNAAEIPVSQIKNPPRIDGKLDDAVWQSAAVHSGFKILTSLDSKKIAQARHQTEVKILADAENIYFGIRCAEPEPGKISGGSSVYGHGPWQNDHIEIFLAPGNTTSEYYQFALSAANGQWNMYYEEGGATRPDPYGAVWDSAVHVGKDFWSVEIRIPFTAFYMTPSVRWSSKWRVNISRERKAGAYEISSWSELNNNFHEIARFNTLTGMPPKPKELDAFIPPWSVELRHRKDSVYSGIFNGRIDNLSPGLYSYEISGDNMPHRLNGQLQARHKVQPLTAESDFKATGRGQYKVSVKNASKRTVAERYMPITLIYSPLEIHLTSPSYRRNFYPGQAHDSISGRVRLNLSPEVEITATLSGAGLKESRQLAIDGKTASFSFDASKMSEGRAELKIRATAQGKTVAEQSIAIRNLPRPAASFTTIEPPGRIFKDGKPLIPRFYYAPEYMLSRALKEKYPNPLAKSPFINFDSPAIGVEFGRILPGSEEKEGIYDVRPSQAIFDGIKAQVDRYRGKDFMFYYLADEPECRSISPVYLKYLYDYLCELDPYHPVMIVSREPAQYLDCADVFSPHHYIGPLISGGKRILFDPIPRQAVRFADKRPDKAYLFTPQAFSYNFMNINADYPSFDEISASIWSAVNSGARGLFPFMYCNHFERPDLRFGLDFIFASAQALETVLGSPSPEQQLQCANPGIYAFSHGDENNRVIIAVNQTDTPQEGVVELPGLKGRPLYLFRENDTVTPAADSLQLSLAPYQVRIYTRNKLDAGLETLRDFRSRLAAENRKLKKPGNLMYGQERNIEISSSSSALGVMSVQANLTNGVEDDLAWRPADREPYLEISFTKFVPKFSSMTLYGCELDNLQVQIWKYGEWLSPEFTMKKEGKHGYRFDFGKTLSTVKLRLSFRRPVSGAEIYELELYTP